MCKILSKSNPVDFLVVGAARSGTTTLFKILSGHPRIFIPLRKECRYFSCMPRSSAGPNLSSPDEIIQSLEEYQYQFEMARPGQLRGDISPDYLYFYKNAVPKIRNEVNAQVPIIIAMRNPIDRAYSNYLVHVRDGWENLSFEEALDAEETRCISQWKWGWNYVDVGLYAKQVKAYLDNFDNILLLIFEEDIVTGKATDKVLNFLNLNPLPKNSADIRANVSGYPRNRILHCLMTDELIVRKIKNMVKATPLYARSKQIYRKVIESNLKKQAMAPKTRRILKEKFREDVALLAEYTGLPVYEFWKDFR